MGQEVPHIQQGIRYHQDFRMLRQEGPGTEAVSLLTVNQILWQATATLDNLTTLVHERDGCNGNMKDLAELHTFPKFEKACTNTFSQDKASASSGLSVYLLSSKDWHGSNTEGMLCMLNRYSPS